MVDMHVRDTRTVATGPTLLLDETAERLECGMGVGHVLSDLFTGLNRLRELLSPGEWMTFAHDVRFHRLSRLIHQDPFTRRSFEKPRGYAGDAVMLDFIYREAPAQEALRHATPLGAAIGGYTNLADASEAVRERRGILADLVDAAARRVPGAHVLAIAAGHLREAGMSEAYRTGTLGRWAALDQDPESVAFLRECWQGPVEAVDGSVKSIITSNGAGLGSFDLIYAAGLYDYLPLPVAQRLTRIALRMLRPGGTFMFANFSQEVASVGFMESFMDWKLIFRSMEDMQEIIEDLDSSGGFDSHARFYSGANRNVHYCELTRI